jgi:hypothetical protein
VQLAGAAARIVGCLRRLVADCAGRSLLPPCPDCPDSDVLLARITLRDCAVLRICTVARPQVHLAGAWSPDRARAWELARRVCRWPAGPTDPLTIEYVERLLLEPDTSSDHDQLLELLWPPEDD